MSEMGWIISLSVFVVTLALSFGAWCVRMEKRTSSLEQDKPVMKEAIQRVEKEVGEVKAMAQNVQDVAGKHGERLAGIEATAHATKDDTNDIKETLRGIISKIVGGQP